MPVYRLLVEAEAPDRLVRLVVDAIPPTLSPMDLLRVDTAVRHLLPPTLPPNGHRGPIVRSNTTTGYLYRYAASLGALID